MATFWQRNRFTRRGRGHFSGEPGGFSASRGSLRSSRSFLVSSWAAHHGQPCPSSRPAPVSETFSRSMPLINEACVLRSIPSQRPSMAGKSSKRWLATSAAPGARSRCTLLRRNRAPHRNRPGGTCTVPPPAAAQASIAFWIALVAIALPSPTAPKRLTS